MPKREIGLMGYVGEAVVELWLRKKYPSALIVSQIIPAGIPKIGGAYLDFGVIQDGIVEAVYEVKSQDYILDKGFPINRTLLSIWSNSDRAIKYATQDGREYFGYADTKACLVLLVGPNEGGIQTIGMDNLKNIVLFEDIWSDLGETIIIDKITNTIREDVLKVLAILQKPYNGKLKTAIFKKIREQQR